MTNLLIPEEMVARLESGLSVVTTLRSEMEAFRADVMERIAATPGLTEEQARGLFQSMMDAGKSDPEFRRRLLWGQGDSRLVGSKYSRWGLSVADVEWLFDLQNSLVGQKRVNSGGVYQGPSEELTRAFQTISEAYYLTDEQVRAIDGKAIEDMFPRLTHRDVQAYEAAYRAMDSAESGYGSQLVGAQYVGDLWAAVRPLTTVFNLIDSFEMTAPTAYLPVEADLPEMLFVAENTANNSSDYTTDKTGSNRIQVDAKKFIIHQMWSGEMEEDSIIPFVPFLRRQMQTSMAYYLDSIVVNGDTTNAATGNINLDDADPADTKHYLALDGIRHAAIVDNTANLSNVAAAPTAATFLALKALMEESSTYIPLHWGYPTDSNDVVNLMDYGTYHQALQFDELITLDKMGPRATILNGQLGSIWGNPIIPTQVVSKTEADGKVSTTGSNNTLGQIVMFNRRAFKTGWRRRVMTETERLPGRDQTRIISSLRFGFGRYSVTGAASGIEAVAVGRNITV